MTKLSTWVAQRSIAKGRFKIEESWTEFQNLQIQIEMSNNITLETEEAYR